VQRSSKQVQQLLTSEGRALLQGWLGDLAENGAPQTQQVSGFVEALLELLDLACWTESDVVSSRIDKVIVVLGGELLPLIIHVCLPQTLRKLYKRFNGSSSDQEERLNPSAFLLLHDMWAKFRLIYKNSSL